MILRKQNLVFLIAIIFMGGCNNKSKEIIEIVDEVKATPKNVIILCDVSNSIDSALIGDKTKKSILFDNMIAQCKSIIRCYAPGSEYKFFFVSRNSGINSFCDFISKSYDSKNKVREKKVFKQVDSLLEKSIRSMYSKPEPQTCLLTSIEHAYSVSASMQLQHPTDSVKLIIISDMIEICDASPLEKVIMNVMPGKKFIIEENIKKIKEYTNSSIKLDKKNIDLMILLNTSGIDAVPKRNLSMIWKTIFSNYGYAKASDNNFELFLEDFKFQKNKIYHGF